MTSATDLIETLPAGSRIIATGDFVSGQQTDLLIEYERNVCGVGHFVGGNHNDYAGHAA